MRGLRAVALCLAARLREQGKCRSGTHYSPCYNQHRLVYRKLTATCRCISHAAGVELVADCAGSRISTIARLETLLEAHPKVAVAQVQHCEQLWLTCLLQLLESCVAGGPLFSQALWTPLHKQQPVPLACPQVCFHQAHGYACRSQAREEAWWHSKL